MRSFFLRVVPSLLAVFAAIPLQAAPPQSPPPPVRVNESSARLTLQDKSSLFSIELAATTQSSLPATLTVRVLNSDDAVLSERSTDLHLTRTPQRAELTLPWSPSNSVEDAARTRLRYEVRLPGDPTPVAQGTLSPAAIIPNLFELSFTGLAEVGSGGTYVAEVWATRPNSTQPVSGVDLQATIGDDDPPPPGLAAHARTNSRGQARLTFHLPEGPTGGGEADLEIKGTLGNFGNSVTGTLHAMSRAAIFLSTDKPLYQPGQTLHIRALLLNDQHRAWPKQPLTFVVKDPDDTTVFTSDVDSSRFGIASVDWSIPATEKLGNYRVNASVFGEDTPRQYQTDRAVRITRYELPTFTVTVKPDQPYYLTGQNAQLTVSADYLFGKPVLRGHVRIVRESHRSWNYREQKWDVEEAPAQEGDLDAKNEFHATLDLAHDHADLLDNDYERFQDLRYAAYLTDASSGRSQERHFDIRISRDAIHLYLNVPRRSIPASFPSTIYLSSFTPDGVPASTDISIKLYSHDPQDHSNPSDLPKLLAETKVRTNRFGVAKAKLPVIPDLPKDARRLFLALQAKTLDGRTGQHLESFDLADENYLSLTPVKAILKPGEPIELLLEATVSKAKYRVDVIDGQTWNVLASQDVSLPHGRARVTFPSSDRFSGLLRVAAHPLTVGPQPSYYRSVSATTAGIIFPHPDDLKLALRPLKASYRPGECATVDLRVRSPQGDATQGALGLLVYDQALEELARSEASLSTGGDSIDPRLGFQLLEENSESLAAISVHDLLNLPPGQSVSSDVELVAESLLFSSYDVPILSEDSTTNWGLDHLFEKNIRATLDPVVKRLADEFNTTGHFPADDSAFHKFVQQNAFDPTSLNDPWGRPYRVRRSYDGLNEVFEFLSDGPDKLSNTGDDFTALSLARPFYTLEEKRLTEIASAYHSRTGDYLRDLASFRAECEHQHSPLSSFLDPWGTPYHFEFAVQGPNYTITATSAGPDRTFRKPDSSYDDDWDDLALFTIRIPYFLETANRISEALFDSANKSLHFADAADFPKILSDHGIDWNSIRDPWGHPYDVVSGVEVSYADKVAVHTYGQTQTTSQIPVTRKIKTLRIISNGPDGKPNSPDDFEVARYSSPLSDETASGTETSSFLSLRPVFSGNSGAIRVRVLDATGAIIPNANVAAINDQTGFESTGTTDSEGLCLLRNLPPGSYHVVVSSQGFQTYAMQSVPVYSSNVTELEVKLQVGAVSQSIMVEASAPTLETSTSSMVVLRPGLTLTTKSATASGRVAMPLATPRLRQYFPETLFWQPEILTDRSGHTTVKFPLADSITTWKVSAIASTLDGHVATTTKEIRAFQPFFAELDPPKVLTVGDEIHLPVTVRKYLDKPQSISLDWAPEPWSESLTPRTATTDVAAGDYAQRIFSFRAKLPMKGARQRLSAYNRSNEKESDAIERQLRIHPDGQERVVQSSSVFSRETSLPINIPSSALPGSIEAELVLYPNLVSHVAEAIEGILHRPYGCAEQTISSAYPSLLWLQLKKSQHLPPSPYDERAQRFLNLAYARLIGYREPGGGFSYWGKGSPNLPLSAYALRFLTEASEFVSVDPDIPNQTRAWLLTQLSPQGVWQGTDYQGKPYDWLTAYYTSYVTRVLAQDLQHPTTDQKVLDAERNAVRRALEYLSTHDITDNDPYRFALIVQAKLALHDDPSKELDALLSTVHPEGEQSYWAAEHNTVFYGWGYAGRIETTALALDALASAKQQGHTSPVSKPPSPRALSSFSKIKIATASGIPRKPP